MNYSRGLEIRSAEFTPPVTLLYCSECPDSLTLFKWAIANCICILQHLELLKGHADIWDGDGGPRTYSQNVRHFFGSPLDKFNGDGDGHF